MKIIIKFFIALSFALLFFLTPPKTQANQAACNPTDIKPTPLGSLVISPDIVPVGNYVVARYTTDGASRVSISVPKDLLEITDYSPKTVDGGTAKAGEWTGKLPAGNYDLTLKAKHFSAGKWAQIDTQADVWGGTTYGHQYFFIYYDTIPVTISLSDRNEVPQTTMDVVRKIILYAVPLVNINITTDKGSLGSNIASNSGKSLAAKTNSDGVAELYLFAQEKQKVDLTASSSDACQDTTYQQSFTIKRSDVGRNIKEDYGWIWQIVIGILVFVAIVLLVLWRKSKQRKLKQLQLLNKTDNSPIPSNLQNQSTQPIDVNKNSQNNLNN